MPKGDKFTKGEALNGIEARKIIEAQEEAPSPAQNVKKNGSLDSGSSPASISSGAAGAPPSLSSGDPLTTEAPALTTTPAITAPAAKTTFAPPSLSGQDFNKTAGISEAGTFHPEVKSFVEDNQIKAARIKAKHSDSQSFLEKDYIEAVKPFDQFSKFATDLYGNYVKNAGGDPSQTIANGSRNIVPSTQQMAEKIGQSTQGVSNYRKARVDQLSDMAKEMQETMSNSEDFSNGDLSQKRKDILDHIDKINDAAKTIVKKTAVSEQMAKKPLPGTTLEERIGKAIREASGDFDITADSKNAAYLASKKSLDDDNEKEYTERLRLKNFNEGAQALSDHYDEKIDTAYQAGKAKIDSFLSLQSALDNTAGELRRDTTERINALKADPAVSNYIDALRDAQETGDRVQNTLETQFPQVQRQQLRQTLLNTYGDMQMENLAGYDKELAKNKYKIHLALASGLQQLVHGLFGDDAGEGDVTELSKRSGIPEDKVREIINMRTGGSFFGKDKSGVRLPGLLQRVAQGTLSTAEGTFVTGTRRFLNTDNADLKNKLVQNKVEDYTMMPEIAKLRDNAGKYNLNAYSVMGTIGETTAQAAVFGAPTLFTGGLAAGMAEAALGLGRGIKVGATAAEVAAKTGKSIEEVEKIYNTAEKVSKAVENLSTVGAGFTGSYESAYQEASKWTGDEKLRRNYAAWSGFWNGASELILSPAEMIKGIHGHGAEASFKTFSKVVQETGSPAIAGLRMSAGVGKFLGKALAGARGAASVGKELGKTLAEENIEELLVNYTDRYGEENMVGHKQAPGEFADKNIETIVQTTLGTLGMGIGGGVGAAQDHSRIRRESLYEAGNEPERYKANFDAMRANGQITQDQYNRHAQVINTMTKIVNNLPEKTTKGRKLSEGEKIDLAALEFRRAHNRKIEDNPAALTAERKAAAADTAETEKQQEAILSEEPVHLVNGKIATPEETAAVIADKENDAHVEVLNDTPLQEKLSARIKGEPEEISKPVELDPNDTSKKSEAEEEDDSLDDLSAASDAFGLAKKEADETKPATEEEAPEEAEKEKEADAADSGAKTTNEQDYSKLRELPQKDKRGQDKKAYAALDAIDFTDKKSVNEGASKIVNILAEKSVPENRIDEILKNTETIIGHEDYRSKDYLERYIAASTKNFDGQDAKSLLRSKTEKEEKTEPAAAAASGKKEDLPKEEKPVTSSDVENTFPFETLADHLMSPDTSDTGDLGPGKAPKPKKAQEHLHYQKSVAIANDEMQQAKTEIEKHSKKSDRPVIGNIGQANEKRRREKLSAAKETADVYGHVKQILAKHANSENLIGDLTKEMNEGGEHPRALHEAIEIVKKAQEYELVEKKKAVTNRIVSLQKDYNSLGKNRAKAKSEIMQQITQLARDIDVTVSNDGEGKLKVLNTNGKALVKSVDKVKADLNGRKTIEERGERFGKFYDAMLPLLLQSRTKQEDSFDVNMPAEHIRSAVSAIRNGKYNENAFDLLDELDEVLQSGVVSFVKQIGNSVVREGVPVEAYLQTEEDIKSAADQLTDEEVAIYEQNGIDPSYFLDHVPDFMVNYLQELLEQEQRAIGEMDAAEEQMHEENSVPAEVWESAYNTAISNEAVNEVKENAPAGDATNSIASVPEQKPSEVKKKAAKPKKEKTPAQLKEDQDIKDAFNEFRSALGTINSGINPDAVAKGVKLVGLLVKKGIHAFSDMVKGLIERGIVLTENELSGMRHAYSAYVSDPDNPDDLIDKMDDSKTVRNFTFDNLKQLLENEQTNDDPEDTGNPETEHTANENDEQVSGGIQNEADSGADESGSEEATGQQQSNNLNNDDGKSTVQNDDAAAEPGEDAVRSDGQDDLRTDNGEQASPDGGTEEQRDAGKHDTEVGGAVQTGNASADGHGEIQPVTSAGDSVAGDHGAVRNVGVNYEAPHEETRFSDKYDKSRMFEANLAALRLLVTLSEDGRNPTGEEQQVLAAYSGFGGLSSVVKNYPEVDGHWNNSDDRKYREQVRELHSIINRLDPNARKGYLRSVMESTANAHYTPAGVIRAIYAGIKRAGFKGGYVLEPSAGIGNFFANMPHELMKDANLAAIEKDPLTGQMLRRLYPLATVQIKGLEEANVLENYYDLVIGNVPFGDYGIKTDSFFKENKDKRYAQASGSIHNYFFVKSMQYVAPGGVMAFITSRYTMDGTADGHKATRQLLAEQGELIGAVRLPEHTFVATAGAEVTSDVIFMRKYEKDEKPVKDQAFVVSSPVTVDEQEVNMNQYFQQNPQNVLGTNTTKSTRWGVDKLVVEGDVNGDLEGQATAAIKKLFLNHIIYTENQVRRNEQIANQSKEYATKEQYDKVGNMVISASGEVSIVSGQQFIDPKLDAKAYKAGLNPDDIRSMSLNHVEEERMKAAGLSYDQYDLKQLDPAQTNKDNRKFAPAVIKMRQLSNKLFYYELNNYGDEEVEAIRKELRDTYTEFTGKNGRIRENKQVQRLLDNDTDQYVVYGLEKIDKDGVITDADMLHKRTINPKKIVSTAASALDASLISMEQLGKVDLGYMAQVMGKTTDELAKEQYSPDHSGFLFEQPDGAWVTNDEYLSGNVKQKLAEAKAAAEENPKMQRNIDALEKVIPEDISPVDIYLPMEARWVPLPMLQDFVNDLFNTQGVRLSFSPSADKVNITGRTFTPEHDAYSTQRWSGTDVLESAINGIEPVVKYTVEKKQFVDEDDTITAKEKYRKMREAWDKWKYQDNARRSHLVRLYNDTYNTTINRSYNGSHLVLPGLLGFTLLKHQKDAIWRFLQTMGGIADHMVGAGKTLIMIATAMEGRRLGMMKKPMIIGLKSQVPQMMQEFRRAYPLAKVLYPGSNDFKPQSRKRFMAQIASNDWDSVILTHNQFKMLKQPKDIQIELENEMIAELEKEKSGVDNKQARKEIDDKISAKVAKVRALLDTAKDEDMKDFGELGIDFLMVDESQEFKNLEFSSAKKNVRGLGDQNGSQRASNLLVAARYLQKLHGGDKGLLFASGTPIANTMGELYLLFKYLRPKRLKEMGINTFDQWAGLFANVYSDLEYNLGSMKEITRFREFVNVPELLTMYREIADVRNAHNLGDAIDRPKAEHHLIKIEPTPYQQKQIRMLKDFIDTKGVMWREELGLTAGWDDVKQKHKSYGLNAQTYARKLSVDPRLINPHAGKGSKITAAAEKIAGIYRETEAHKGVQLVFNDLGTPKSSNPTSNVRDYLIQEGLIGKTDLDEIFGEDFENKAVKPKLPDLEASLKEALQMSGTEYKAFLNEATNSKTFDAYTALRQELIDRGIPKEQIEFIHDHNGDTARQKLYDRVNNGDVRVLIGSTGKMGVGVNVQRRAIAAHHLDINWKPSDLEQRNGRIERQKNLLAKTHYGNRVQIYYYATEKTLDASMYEVVKNKAKFIAQMKVDGTPQRRMDDLEGDVDLGAMSAELSGDELFKEKNQLEKSVREKMSLKNSYLYEKYANETKVEKMKGAQEALQTKIDAHKNVLMPFYDSIPRDEEGKLIYSAEVPGHAAPFEKPGKAGEAIAPILEQRMKDMTGKSFLVAKMWGANVLGEKVRMAGIEGDQSFIERKVIAPDGQTVIESGKELSRSATSTGIQLAAAIRDIPETLARLEKELAKNKEVAAKIAEGLNEPFSHEEQLERDKTRLADVDRQMRERSIAERTALEARAKDEEQATDDEMGDANEEYEMIKWNEAAQADQTATVRDGMTVNEVLSGIAAENTNVSELATALQSIISGKAGSASFRVDINATRSFYNQAKNEIVMTAGDAVNPFKVVHEMLHAATASKLPPVSSREEVEAILNDKNASHEIKHLANLFLVAADKLGATIGEKNGAYAFSNLDEFVSEAFSNKDFQKQLAGLRYTVGKSVRYEMLDRDKGKTIWRSFIDAIRNLVGLDEETPHTLLEAVISATKDLIKNDDGILEDSDAHGKTGERTPQKSYTKSLLYSEASKEEKLLSTLTNIALIVAKRGQDKAQFYEFMQENHNYGSTPEEKRNMRLAFEGAEKILAAINEKFSDVNAMNDLITNAISPELKKTITSYVKKQRSSAAPVESAPQQEAETPAAEAPAEAGQAEEQQQAEAPKTDATNSMNDEGDFLAGFAMRSTGDMKQLESGKTFEDVYLKLPEGTEDHQNYTERKLADMQVDGDNMIQLAKQAYGSDNIEEYAPKLFQYIMGNNWKDLSKEVVLLGRLLHELQVAKVKGNDGAIVQKLQSDVFRYYQAQIRKASLTLNAGRLLRILRDNDLGEFYAEKILTEKQVKEKRDLETNIAATSAEEVEKIAEEEKIKPTEETVKEVAEEVEEKKEESKKQKKSKKKSSEYAEKAKEALAKIGDKSALQQKIADILKNIKKC